MAAGPNVNGVGGGNNKAHLGGTKSLNGNLVPSHKSKHKKSAKKVANNNNLGTLSSASTAAVNGVPNHHSPMLNSHYGIPNSSQAVHKPEQH